MTSVPASGRGLPAPADVALSTLRGARVAAVVVHAPATAFLILNTGTAKLGNLTADPAWLPVACMVLGLQGYLVVSAIQRRTPRWGGLVWLGVVACVAALVWHVGQGDLTALWFVAAAGAFAFRPRLGAVVLVATIVVFVFLAVTGNLACQCWDYSKGVDIVPASVFYNVVSGTAGAIGPFMAARLLGVVDDLARTRAQLELTAADEERRRLSRDLHDVLGQGLSAVSLKGDLALALLDKDPSAAQREIDDLIDVTRHLRAELPDIMTADRSASYDVEARRAERLLREAGVDVRRQGELGAVREEVDSALGWVVREAATNVLRHSDARQWVVRAGHGQTDVWLEATNDRPLGSAGPAGSGLLGMAERMRAVGGQLRTHADAQRFTLRVEVAQ